MVRRVVIRVLELPISLSVGVLRQSASLAGRVVSRLVVGGGSSEEPVPPPAPEPRRSGASKRASASTDELAPARAKPRRSARPRGERPARTRTRKRPEDNRAAGAAPSTSVQGDSGRSSQEAATEASAEAPQREVSAPESEVSSVEAPQREVSAPESEVSSVEAPQREVSAPESEVAARESEAAQEESQPEASPPDVPEREVEHEPGEGTSVRAPDPHSPLNTPIGEPDPTEWPDPYDHREDPRDLPEGQEMVFGGDEAHTHTGATSTSEPHPGQDPEAEPWEGPKRDRVDR
jgi:hypothetical protein